MNVSKMIETLKGMGLSKIEREKCEVGRQP